MKEFVSITIQIYRWGCCPLSAFVLELETRKGGWRSKTIESSCFFFPWQKLQQLKLKEKWKIQASHQQITAREKQRNLQFCSIIIIIMHAFCWDLMVNLTPGTPIPKSLTKINPCNDVLNRKMSSTYSQGTK